MERKKKTYYCLYSNDCNRDEDCFNGEYCPLQAHNDLISRREPDDENQPFNIMYDEMWNGEQ